MSIVNSETKKFVESELFELAETGSVKCKIDSLNIQAIATDLQKSTTEIEKNKIKLARKLFSKKPAENKLRVSYGLRESFTKEKAKGSYNKKQVKEFLKYIPKVIAVKTYFEEIVEFKKQGE